MRTKLRNFFLFASIAALAMGASAQNRPVGGNEAGNGAGNGGNTGWSYNPAKEGMKDLFQMRPIEGCNVAGGLQPITSSDEGDSAMFWCGTPPYCLTQPAIAAGEQCTILQYARRNPRYDPNGTPGANGVRDPEDLRCVNTGLQPINGRCPTVPSAGITLNNSTNLTVNKGGSVTLRVTTSGSQAEWGGSTSLSCTGTNSNRSPFNRTNVNDFLNRSNASVGSNTMPSNGTMTCTLTVTNTRGSRSATAKVTVKNPPPPPPSGGGSGGGGGSVPEEPLAPSGRVIAGTLHSSTGGGGGGPDRVCVVVVMRDGSVIASTKSQTGYTVCDSLLSQKCGSRTSGVTGAETSSLKSRVDSIASTIYVTGLVNRAYYVCK